MPSLRDLINPKAKEKLVPIDIGGVYRIRLTKEDGIIPKDGDDSRNKYFIIIGIDEDSNIIGHVVINTNINHNLPQVLRDLQYPINCSKYDFLEDKSRYVDCSDIKQIAKHKFLNLYQGKSGNIEDEDLKHIKDAVKSSPKVALKLLKRFNIV